MFGIVFGNRTRTPRCPEYIKSVSNVCEKQMFFNQIPSFDLYNIKFPVRYAWTTRNKLILTKYSNSNRKWQNSYYRTFELVSNTCEKIQRSVDETLYFRFILTSSFWCLTKHMIEFLVSHFAWRTKLIGLGKLFKMPERGTLLSELEQGKILGRTLSGFSVIFSHAFETDLFDGCHHYLFYVISLFLLTAINT